MPHFIVVEGPNRGAAISLLPTVNRLGREGSCEVFLPDDGISRVHAMVELADDGAFWIEDRESKNGTWLNGVRLESRQRLEEGDELRLGNTVLRFADGQARPEPGSTLAMERPSSTALRQPSAARGPTHYLIGNSEAMRRIGRLIERCAPLDTTVLIRGESGTGKELVARGLHQLGPRRRRPFVAVNCATVEPALADSELFGHERGAFTGAACRKLGRFEVAGGGTLFLDEVAELPPKVQAKLLRALENRTFCRVGGHQEIPVEARIVAATHADLAQRVQQGRFREDLLYRLQVVVLEVPPLRDRREDIDPLLEHFLALFRTRIPTPARRFSQEARAVLDRYGFPGNIRELKNLVERALIFAESEEIALGDLNSEVRRESARYQDVPEDGPDGQPLSLTELEQHHLGRVLARTGGNKSEAARLLGIDRATLYAKLKRHGMYS